MAIQLPYKIVGNFLYTALLLVLTGRRVAFAYMQADSCQHLASPVVLIQGLLSAIDRKWSKLLFMISTPNFDNSDCCSGMVVRQRVAAPSSGVVRLGQRVSGPVWSVEYNTNLVELTYRSTVLNLAINPLGNRQVADDLSAIFSSSDTLIRFLAVWNNGGQVVNPAYFSLGTETTLLSTGNLISGKQSRIWRAVRLDVSQANTATFTNNAMGIGVDMNEGICQDRSINGIGADPGQQYDPSGKDEPALVTFHSLRPVGTDFILISVGLSLNEDRRIDL